MKKTTYIAPRIEVIKIEGATIMVGSGLEQGKPGVTPIPEEEEEEGGNYWGD